MGKWVYSFGAGQAEGTAAMGGLLGGKGANLAEMAQLGLAVPPGFTLTTEICSHYYQHDRRYPDDLKAEVEAALLRGRERGRQRLRRPRATAAAIGPLGRAGLDARHDGHGAQSRAQRSHGRGAGAQVRRCPVCLRQLPPLHADVWRRGPRPRSLPVRGPARGPQARAWLHPRHRASRRGPGGG